VRRRLKRGSKFRACCLMNGNPQRIGALLPFVLPEDLLWAKFF
jgi:hypothetical protein